MKLCPAELCKQETEVGGEHNYSGDTPNWGLKKRVPFKDKGQGNGKFQK